MKSKLFVNPDGTAKMQEIRIEARGKGGGYRHKSRFTAGEYGKQLKSLQNAAGSIRQVHTDYRVLQMLS